MRTVLDKIDKGMACVENALIICGLASMFFILLAQVFMRYVFNSPITWSEEAARFIFVYVSFIGISFAYRMKTQIRMEAVTNLFSKKIQKALRIFVNIATIALFYYMIPFSFEFIKIQANVKSTATHIPMSIVYIALPLGLALAGIRLLIENIRILRGYEEDHTA